MNRYFYVSVINDGVTYNGVSFRDILKTANSELYEQCLNEENESKMKNLFRKYKLPHKIIIVYNGGVYYELSTEFPLNVSEFDVVGPHEVSGNQVVDIFMDNPDYTDTMYHMMSEYNLKAVTRENKVKTMK